MARTYTNDEIREMFALRAKGTKLQSIANRFDCSDSHVSNIILRNNYDYVDVPETILEKVKGYRSVIAGKPLQARIGKKYPRKAKHPTVPLHEALASYTAACHVMQDAKEMCLKAGACSDTLELLRESVRNGE